MCKKDNKSTTVSLLPSISKNDTHLDDNDDDYDCAGSWSIVSNTNTDLEDDSRVLEISIEKEENTDNLSDDRKGLKPQSVEKNRDVQKEKINTSKISDGGNTALVPYQPNNNVLGVSAITAPVVSQSNQRYKGIKNLGNTCYMSSALQMLMSIDGFVQEVIDSYLQDSIQEEKRCDDYTDNDTKASLEEDFPSTLSKSGHNQVEIKKKSIRDALAQIFLSSRIQQHTISSTTLSTPETKSEEENSTTASTNISTNAQPKVQLTQVPINPQAFKKILDEKTSLFLGYKQQDSHEFFSTLIDMLHDELKQEIPEMKSPVDKEFTSRNTKESSDLEKKEKEKSKGYVLVEQMKNNDTSMNDGISKEQPGTDISSANEIGISKVPSYSELNAEAIDDLLHGKKATNVKTTNTMSNISPVDTYFTTEINICLTCDSCNYSRSHKEIHRYLSLEVNDKNSGNESIEEGLRRYFEPEKREVKCEKCFSNTSSQTMEIARLPRCLLLHLKRFIVEVNDDYSQINYRKNQAAIEFGNTLSLNVNDHHGSALGECLCKNVSYPSCSPEDVNEIVYVPKDEVIPEVDEVETSNEMSIMGKYKIRSVINHLGGNCINRGHYFLDALKTYDDDDISLEGTSMPCSSWTRFNDSKVSRIDSNQAIEGSQKSAIMIAYEFTR